MDKRYYLALIKDITDDIEELNKQKNKIDYHNDAFDAYTMEDGRVVTDSRVRVLMGQIDEAYEMRSKLCSYISEKKPVIKYKNHLTKEQAEEMRTGVKYKPHKHVKVHVPGTYKPDGCRSRSFLISIPATISKERISEYKTPRKKLDAFITNYIGPKLKRAGYKDFAFKYFLPSAKGKCILRVKVTIQSKEPEIEEFCESNNYIYWPFTGYDRDEAIIHIDNEFPMEGIILNTDCITL